jgi:hypothetical protein
MSSKGWKSLFSQGLLMFSYNLVTEHHFQRWCKVDEKSFKKPFLRHFSQKPNPSVGRIANPSYHIALGRIANGCSLPGHTLQFSRPLSAESHFVKIHLPGQK